MPPTPSLQYYCELLPNIQSISVSIAFATPSDASTRLIIPPGSQILYLEHRGEKSTLRLPGPGNPNPEPLIVTPQPHQPSLSLRIPCTEKIDYGNDNITPWSARHLASRPTASIHCRTCGATIMAGQRIKSWKDLPSGNWAEAMDFWHCHKPHEKDGEKSKYASYGSGFQVIPGTGLIDGIGFLFSGQDVAEAVQNSRTGLSCKECDGVLGRLEHDIGNASELWRIHKWNIRLRDGGSECVYPLECFLASEFIGFAEGEGVRRLLISERNNGGGARLKVWIFNTDIYYSHPDVDQPERGIKVYWCLLEAGEKSPPTDGLSAASFEAMELDSSVLKRLMEDLQKSGKFMPNEMRAHGEWRIGIMRRFQEKDVALI